MSDLNKELEEMIPLQLDPELIAFLSKMISELNSLRYQLEQLQRGQK